MPHYDIIAINDMRKRYSDGPLGGRGTGVKEIRRRSEGYKERFTELCGGGMHPMSELAPRSFIIVYVKKDPKVLLNTFQSLR